MPETPQKIFLFAPEIHPPFIEGVQKTAWSFACEFVRQGHFVEVVTGQSYGERFAEEITEGVRVRYWFSAYRIRFFKYMRWISQSVGLVRHIKRERPQAIIIFSLDLPFFIPLAVMSFFVQRPRITLSIFSWREITGLGKFLLKLFTRGIDRYIVRSDFMRRELLKMGIVDKDIEIILPFPNKEKFLSAGDGGKRRPRSVAYFSNVDYAAGAGTMLDIARRLPEFQVTIAVRKFSEEYEHHVVAFEQKIIEQRLANVVLVRTLPDIAAFFKQTENVIVPVLDMASTMDVPMVLVEALASGCRVFVYRLPIFSWLVAAGYVEEFETTDELEHKLSTVRTPEQLQLAKHFVGALPSVAESAHRYLS